MDMFTKLVIMAASDGAELMDFELDCALDYYDWCEDSDKYFN